VTAPPEAQHHPSSDTRLRAHSKEASFALLPLVLSESRHTKTAEIRRNQERFVNPDRNRVEFQLRAGATVVNLDY
jgi:hypothetical protein